LSICKTYRFKTFCNVVINRYGLKLLEISLYEIIIKLLNHYYKLSLTMTIINKLLNHY
jgi:hypothetical protein